MPSGHSLYATSTSMVMPNLLAIDASASPATTVYSCSTGEMPPSAAASGAIVVVVVAGSFTT